MGGRQPMGLSPLPVWKLLRVFEISDECGVLPLGRPECPLANRPLSMRKRTHFKYQAPVSACNDFELLELGSTNYNKQEAQIVRLHELRVEPHTAEETSSTLEHRLET